LGGWVWEVIEPLKVSGVKMKLGWGRCYNHWQMTLRNFIKITAFILIAVGTAGLLLNEFVFEHSSTCTIIFAVVDFVGLVNLAFAFWGMRGD